MRPSAPVLLMLLAAVVSASPDASGQNRRRVRRVDPAETPVEGGAKVFVLELEVRYGDERGRGSLGGPGEVEEVNDWLTVHTLQLELADDDAHRTIDLAGWHAELSIERGQVGLHCRYDRRHRHMMSRRSITAGNNLQIVQPPRPRESTTGGTVRLGYVVAWRDGPAWGPEPKAADARTLLRYALARTRQEPNRINAAFALDLARFVPLSSFGFEESRIKDLLGQLREVSEGGNEGFSPNYDLEGRADQAALASGLADDWSAGLDGWARGARSDWFPTRYAGYRYLAECTEVPDRARLVAFGRAYGARTGIDFHDGWIDLLRSGELPCDARLRNEIIERLEAEVRGRRLGPLILLAGGTMAALLLSLVGLRWLARRVMFG